MYRNLQRVILNSTASFLFVAIVALVAATPAGATDLLDLTVGLKTLPMLDDALSGEISIAIVYDAENPESKADADMIKSAIDSGVKGPGNMPITGVLVPATDTKTIAASKIAFVARGTQKYFDSISSIASASSILTISADLECVRENKCILGIVSKPSVDIYLSRAASRETKVSFDPAFLMLIKKV